MRMIKKMLAPLKRRIYLMLGRAVLNAVADDASRQYAQITALANETKDNVERIQEYGFTSNPHPGAQVVFINFAGNRDHPAIIAVDDPRYRKNNLATGEVALYTDEGDFIHFKRGKIIEIKAATKLRIDTPLLEVTGEIKDRADTDGKTMEEIRNIYNAHTHTGDSGGSTSTPGTQM